MFYEVRPILAGEFGPVFDSVKFRNGDITKAEMVPSYVYHVNSERREVLVDTSFTSAEKCTELLGLKCLRQGSFLDLLRKNGVDPEKIDTIIYTHLHWDHAGNGRLFPNARIICQEDEIAPALAPPEWEQGYSRVFASDIADVLERVEPVSGDTVIDSGLEVVQIGGHTRGSQAIVVDTIKGKVVITGDTVMTTENIERNVPIGLFVNLDECTASLKWLRQYDAAIIYPGHCWRAIKQVRQNNEEERS